MNGFLLTAIVLGLSGLLSWYLGRYMAHTMDPGDESKGVFQRLVRSLAGAAGRKEQSWKQYCTSMLIVNAAMFFVVFAILAFQQFLPLNPDKMGAIEPSLIFNTAASFTSNTNLQHYSGESTLSQIGGLMWLQFVSAGTGIAVLTALARGLSGRNKMGNFYRDYLRASLLVLLPVAFLWAIGLVLGSMPMTFDGSASATTLEGAAQTIARGPVAAFVSIKQLGTNGGGFFGPNSTHPFENPTMFTNVLELMAIVMIPMACVWMFGRITGRMRHAGVIFAVMLTLILGKASLAFWAESADTVALRDLPVEQIDYNMEGKELRLGAGTGPLWAVATTSTSNGSVGAMHDSLNPLAGMAPMIGMWLNETFGGVGVGFINMFIYIVIAVFLAGLMIGRTPEYLGRKIEAHEMKLAVIALIAHPVFILGGTALFAATAWGAGSVANPGPHGFSEILYEFSSASANNGSGFEGLGDNTVPWNIATGVVMLLARFIPIILPLAIAGSLAEKKSTAQSAGTLSADGSTFGIMLLGTIVFIGALTFFPVALLGPIAEHLMFN